MTKTIYLILLLQFTISQNYVNNVQEFCKNVKFETNVLSEEEIKSKRSSQLNMLSSIALPILKFYENQDEVEFLSGAIGMLIFPLLLALIAIITLVFSILFFFILLQAVDQTK